MTTLISDARPVATTLSKCLPTSRVPEPAHRPISPPCTAPSGDIAASGASRHSSSTGCGNILAPVTATTTLPGMDTTMSCQSGHLPHTATWGLLGARSEEHTSELQSRFDLVCRLLLEKKNTRLLHIHVKVR